MAKYVNEAFKEFMDEVVNLDPDVVSDAKDSRDNLIENIKEFDNDDFFHLYNEIHIEFGSFARKTKMRPLDDIDLMIGISADGATYNSFDSWEDVRVTASKTSTIQQNCTNVDGLLNSTMVLNMFKDKVAGLREYSRSELHRNGEAVTLNLKSREWAFDIVPCFQTVVEENGRNYYLIPNGKGGWQKTDPRRDRDFVYRVDSKHNGKVKPLVRLCKKWFEVKKFSTPASYLMETLIVRYCDQEESLNDYIRYRFINFLYYLKDAINNDVQDMKDIQDNINQISKADKEKISERAKLDNEKAYSAYIAETKEYDHEKAINLWGEVFGQDFPTYG